MFSGESARRAYCTYPHDQIAFDVQVVTQFGTGGLAAEREAERARLEAAAAAAAAHRGGGGGAAAAAAAGGNGAAAAAAAAAPPQIQIPDFG